MNLAVLAGRVAVALAEHSGEILAGLETAAECDLGDARFPLI
jgi:hypothetical protein